MHQAAKDYIEKFSHTSGLDGLRFAAIDIGGRETNGHARDVFPEAQWLVVDAVDGPGVDIVADGRFFQPTEQVDLVMFAEVAEHTPYWREIIANIATMLHPGGFMVMTAAGPGRPVHGLYHDDPNKPGHYENIDPFDLTEELGRWFTLWEIDVLADDVRAWGQV